MNRMLILGSLLFIALAQSGCAMDRQSGRMPMSFEQLDADGNGLINNKEFLAQAPNGRRSPEDMFKQFDDDGTGTITPEEFKDAIEKMQSERNTRSRGGSEMGGRGGRGGGMKGGGW